jgi:hypothetical protein
LESAVLENRLQYPSKAFDTWIFLGLLRVPIKKPTPAKENKVLSPKQQEGI